MVSSQVFEIIIRRHQKAVRAFLTQLTGGDVMLADDLAQETFIKAYYAWDTFAALSSVKTWLFRIAYNTFYDYERQHHLTEDVETAIVEKDGCSTVLPHVQLDIQMDIRQAMLLLTPAERICIQLAVIEGLSVRRVAQIIQMNENTVKTHIKRGKEKLKTYLINNGYDQ